MQGSGRNPGGIQVTPSKSTSFLAGKKVKIDSLSFHIIPSHSMWNPTKFLGQILSQFPPHSHLIPTSFPPHSHLIPTSFPPHSHLIPTSFLPHSHLIPTSFPPHSCLIFPCR